MDDTIHQLISLDLPALLTALCASLSCALVGNFLVLRKQALLGDAISHAVLPGIVLAYIFSGSRASFPVFLGAAAAGLIAVLCIELLRLFARVEASAAMGVIFSIFFAGGIVLIEQAAARNVDLDADCLLHGQLETIFWIAPREVSQLLSLTTLSELPGELYQAGAVLLCVLCFVALFWKELKLVSFDQEFAANLGFSPNSIHILLMIAVAGSVVASFAVVGSILVIAMLVVPAAVARLYTDSLSRQCLLSVVVAAVAVVLGYFVATRFSQLTGLPLTLNAAGMMASVLGVLLGLSVVFAPRYGVLARTLRVWALGIRVFEEDVLGLAYRHEELCGSGTSVMREALRKLPTGSGMRGMIALYNLRRDRFLLEQADGSLVLTEAGRTRGQAVVRNHRLWEWYLVHEAGLGADHVHESAERLEHVRQDAVSVELQSLGDKTDKDPHGKDIPSS